LLEFQAKKKISESILLRRWTRNASNIENHAYKTLIFAYNKKLDLLVLASSITKSDLEEESSPPYPKKKCSDGFKRDEKFKGRHPCRYTIVCNGF
jgi:hypothetical protein